MTRTQKIVLAVLALLLAGAGGAILYTRDWATSARRLHADQLRAAHTTQQIVDTSALQTAQQLAPLAVTHWEQEYAQQALRLADRSVDLAFNAALDDAKENPAPLTPETAPLAARVKDADARLNVDQERVAQLTAALEKARPSAKDNVQDQIDLAKAQESLDQDELDDAHEDLTRAGGGTNFRWCRTNSISTRLPKRTLENRQGRRAGGRGKRHHRNRRRRQIWWRRWKRFFRCGRRKVCCNRRGKMRWIGSSSIRPSMRRWKSSWTTKKCRRKFCGDVLQRKRPRNRLLLQELRLPIRLRTKLPLHLIIRLQILLPDRQMRRGRLFSQLTYVKHLSADQKALALYDKRMEAEQALATTYGNWLALVVARRHAFLHALFLCILWIALVTLIVFVANIWVQKLFAELSMDRRQLHTVQGVTMFAVQAIGAALILLIVFGMPSNFATVLALAGAGITVAMKDFIVGFFGWFVLMGNNGIRPGDWVEINGVAGEVLQVGLLHTVILETGSWADAGHPTGRKVTFVNSFAIEGHYFNFSTSGQWLWDEIQVQAPGGQRSIRYR